MKTREIIKDILECFEFNGPDCTVGVIQSYLNGKRNASYKYKEVYKLMNYYCSNCRPLFHKESRGEHIYFWLLYDKSDYLLYYNLWG